MLLREFAERIRRWPGNALGQLEIVVVFLLAKILRTEQFLGADNLRALLRRAFGHFQVFLQVRRGIGGTLGLEQSQADDG
jgi:hypothetical protein